MTAGQSILQSSLRGILGPPQASYRPLVPLSADNRLISPAAVRSFAHELVPAAIGLRGRETVAASMALPGVVEQRFPAPRRAGVEVFGTSASEEPCRVCRQDRDPQNLLQV